MIGGALTLYAWRAPLLKSQAGFDLSARESFLLFNNILLVIAAATVLGGTLAPLISDTLGPRNAVGGYPVLQSDIHACRCCRSWHCFAGCPRNWKRGRLSDSKRTLLMTFIIAAITALIVVYACTPTARF